MPKDEIKKEVSPDTLPVEITDFSQEVGNITYANEVIATIAGVATNEVEGIAGMYSSGGISEILGKNRNVTRGVKVEIGTEEASVDLYVIIEYGTPIHKAAQNAQENVKKAIETMTGLHVVRVDVHVQGVSFEKETKALAKGAENASLPTMNTKRLEESRKQEKEAAAEEKTSAKEKKKKEKHKEDVKESEKNQDHQDHNEMDEVANKETETSENKTENQD